MDSHAPSTQQELRHTLGVAEGGGRGRRAVFWVLAALLLAASAGGGYYYVQRRAPAPRFQMALAQRGDLTDTVTATGTLQPVNTVEVGTEISGRIQAVHVDFNDRVRRNQVLAELDQDLLRARVLQAQATLKTAQATRQDAEATLFEARAKHARAKTLASTASISTEELQSAQGALLRAEAAVARTKAQVTLAQALSAVDELNLQKSRIRSPIDGIVISRSVEPGQTVVASFQAPVLFTLAEDLRRMDLHVDIDEADVGQVAQGQAATFTVDAFPERRFSARLAMVRNAPRSVQGVVTYEGLLSVDNTELLLRPGMTCITDIVTAQRKDVLRVPNGALRFTPPEQAAANGTRPAVERATAGQGRVWTLREGKPVAIDLRTGLSDGRMTEVLSGGVVPGQALLVDLLAKK